MCWALLGVSMRSVLVCLCLCFVVWLRLCRLLLGTVAVSASVGRVAVLLVAVAVLLSHSLV